MDESAARHPDFVEHKPISTVCSENCCGDGKILKFYQTDENWVSGASLCKKNSLSEGVVIGAFEKMAGGFVFDEK